MMAAASRRTLGPLAACLALLLCGSGAAGAAIPKDFYGVAPVTVLSPSENSLAKHGGVDGLRPFFYWSSIEPTQGQFDFTQTDTIVRNAASAGLAITPVLFQTPTWASGCTSDRHCLYYAPIGNLEPGWINFLDAVAARYGPGGTFWTDPANAGVPDHPIRTWIVWNEENSAGYFEPNGASPSEFEGLLRASAKAIHAHDSGAKIVLGGLAGGSNVDRNAGSIPAGKFLAKLYADGARRYFDAVALHPYSNTIKDLRQEVSADRKVMTKHGDAATPVWLTELGWGSNHSSSSLSVGIHGQAKLLRKAFQLVLAHRTEWNVARLFWFTWRDVSPTPCLWCGHAGLFTEQLQPKPSWGAFKSFAKR